MILVKRKDHVCPLSHAGKLTSWLRRMVHNPDKIISGFVKPGNVVMDIGCGPGFFSTELAKIVGIEGVVFAIDLQREMLDLARNNAQRAGVDSQMIFHQCSQDQLGLTDKADFILIFWVLHEIPNKDKIFAQLSNGITEKGTILISEPLVHVRKREFMEIYDLARRHQLDAEPYKGIPLSRSMILRKK